MGLKTSSFPEDIDEWIRNFVIMRKDHLPNRLDDDVTDLADRVDHIGRWRKQQDHETLHMTSLRDVQHYCINGTFPPRKAKKYGNLTTFAICFQTDGTPTRDIHISPDECRTVSELKDLIQTSTLEWFGEPFLLNAATLEVEDKANVESAKSIKFSIENDEEW